MENKVRITADPRTTSCLTIHPETAARLGIKTGSKVWIEFGINRTEVITTPHFNMKLHEICVSNDILTQLRLPSFPEYRIRLQGQTLLIGPFIGILATVEEKKLEDHASYLDSFVRDYEQIGGMVVAFSLEGVKMNEQTIDGILYNPTTKRWEKGTFAYPAAMFSILEVSMTEAWEQFQQVLNHFYSVLGQRIFNYPIFDKWQMYQWLKEIPKVQPHLPETVLLTNLSYIEEMLYKHRKIYIKPITGRLGVGIMEAIYEGQKVFIKSRIDGRNVQHVFHSRSHFLAYIQKTLPSGDYIIQEAINLLKINGRIMDFRLMLVKDNSGLWSNMGLLCRYGAKNSVVSNISSGGYAQWGKTALKRVLHIDRQSAIRWNRRMTALALCAANEIEKYGIHCGNLGFDLAIDANKKLWLIEINNQNPDHVIAVCAGRTDKFLQARRANMLYASKLAGFTNEE